MYRVSNLIFLLVGIIFLAACHKGNEVNIVSRNFENEIDLKQNLLFSFDKDLWPDSLLQQWDSNTYIEFTPKVEGMFKWNSSSELSFSPAKSFLPGTKYKAVFTQRVFNHLEKKYTLGKNKTIHFHTPSLNVTHTHLSWKRSGDYSSVIVQADLNFNYEVEKIDAASKVKISYKGKQIPFNVNGQGKGKTLTFQFLPLNDKDEETQIKIDIAKGIKVIPESTASGEKDYLSEKDTSFTAYIPSRFKLSLSNFIAQHNGEEGTITINTSQPIVKPDLKSHIKIIPEVEFDVDISESGFLISSKNLLSDKTYEVIISKSLEGEFGGKLTEEVTEQVYFGELSPAITFANQKGMYLSSKGFKNLALNIVNVPEVQVTIIKVFENNLDFFLRRSKQYDYMYDEKSDNWNEYYYYNTHNLGDTIFSQTYITQELPSKNSFKILHLDFTDKLRSYDGMYVVSVNSKDHYWIQDSKVLNLSDIGLIAREEKNKIYVFANSIKTTEALNNVTVSFISSTNQKVYTTQTDKNGIAVFENIHEKAPGFQIGLVTAKKDNEFSFISFNNNRIETSRFDVGGRMPHPTGLNVMLYAERDLYRPGEKINVSAVIRNDDWSLPPSMPVKLKLIMPNGKEFTSIRKIINEQGSCEAQFDVPHTALTGTYTLEAYSGNDVLLQSYYISIEEFMPDRIKVTSKIDKSVYALGENIHVNIQADNLFGTPATGRNYHCQLNLSKTEFKPKEFETYDFSINNDFYFTPVLREGKTNEAGSALQIFTLGENIGMAGILKGNVMTSVFDETGRPVHRYENFMLYTQNVFLGIKSDQQYVATRQLVKIPIIALDKDENVQSNISAKVSVIKKEWHTVIEQSGNGYRYKSQLDEKLISSTDIKISGKNSYYTFVPELSGDYEVRVAIPGVSNHIACRIWAWGSADTRFSSFEVNNEGNVSIKTDKESYMEGDNINILFTTPFEGKMLVTLERDGIIEHTYLQTNNRSASLKVKCKSEYLPNIYITATLIRPMDDSDMPLTIAHGIRSVKVENNANILPVKIEMPEKTRSKTTQTITIKTTPGAYVTIAAVDEGILQVKNYKTPDPYNYFYQKAGLAVNSYNMYPLLLPEIKTNRTSTGGDGVGDANNLRVNPNFVNRVNLVSYWSGILKANNQGIVKYNINLPQFSGDVRVMAYAYKGKAFGSLDHHVKVADPVIISTALPRFLSPTDEVIVPVTLSNTTSTNATGSVFINTSGNMQVDENHKEQVTIKPNSEARVVFKIKANQSIGEGKVTVSINTLGETFTDETFINIRPTASLQKITGSGEITASNPFSFIWNTKFIPATFNGQLIVSKSPLIQFSKSLDELIRYPHGCVEQITSVAFPQLYFQDIVKSTTGKKVHDLNPNYNVQQAIAKIQSMQLFNGALSYWPGGGYESWWGSVYATHFLYEAKKAGFDVNEQTIKRLCQYLKTRLQKRETETWYYNQNQSRKIAPREAIYSLYVLAMIGDPQVNIMNYYKSNSSILSIDSRYLLAAAYTYAGMHEVAKSITPKEFGKEHSNHSFGGSFYSYIRDLAISLNTLIDIDPNHPQIGIMAKQLSTQILAERYLNTQQNAFSILALGKLARLSNTSEAKANITSNGKKAGSVIDQNLVLNLKDHFNQNITTQVTGSGKNYYFWEMSGITEDGSYVEEDNFMKVRRAFFDRNGNLITNNTFKQNELIIVRVTIAGQYSGLIENVVITDMLPAGMEIENTRLNDMPNMAWIKNNIQPNYIDFRDDRVNIYCNVTGNEANYYYMLRAVSPGNYQLGPIQADAMYNGYYHSYHGAGKVIINP